MWVREDTRFRIGLAEVKIGQCALCVFVCLLFLCPLFVCLWVVSWVLVSRVGAGFSMLCVCVCLSVCVHRIHTLSVHHEHYSLLTSTDHMCACGSGLEAKGREGLSRIVSSFLCSEKNPSSGQPCHLLAGLCFTFSLPVHRNTKHHLDSTTFSKTTLDIEHLFQYQYSRQAALMNRSRTSITRVAENCANTSPTGYEPKELATISGSSPENIYQLYDVQGELGEQHQQAPIVEDVEELGQIGNTKLTRSRDGRGPTC